MHSRDPAASEIAPHLWWRFFAAERSEGDSMTLLEHRVRRVFEEANARYEASKHIGASRRLTVQLINTDDVFGTPTPGSAEIFEHRRAHERLRMIARK